MPVEDHPVHAAVIRADDAKYGCWNRNERFAKSYWAPERRFFPDGSFDVTSVRVPHVTSHECRYDGRGFGEAGDPGCAGCAHYLVSGYVKRIMGSA